MVVCDAHLLVIGVVPDAHLCAGRVYHVCVLCAAEQEHQNFEQAVRDPVGVKSLFVRAECRAMRCRVGVDEALWGQTNNIIFTKYGMFA